MAQRILKEAGAALDQVQFLRWPTNRGWMRDSGPIFVRRDGEKPESAIVHFHFNAWAKYPDWKKDRRVPERAARLLGGGAPRLYHFTLPGESEERAVVVIGKVSSTPPGYPRRVGLAKSRPLGGE